MERGEDQRGLYLPAAWEPLRASTHSPVHSGNEDGGDGGNGDQENGGGDGV